MKRAPVVHPFLFAIFPVLFLYARNIDLFHVGTILGPIVATACLALLSWVVLSFVLKDMRKAGLIISVFFLLFFSYETFLDGTKGFLRGRDVSRYWTREYLWAYLLLAWALLFALATYLLTRIRWNLRNLTNIANVVASALVVMSLINIGAYEIETGSAWQSNLGTGSTPAMPVDLEKPGTLPNIYYIILDGYAGADILQEIYQYDNSELLDYLTNQGFYVATDSRSNYVQTALSLASSLNLMYLDALADRIGAEYPDRVPAFNMIRSNRVFRFLKHYGYGVVAFSSGWSATETRNADIYMAARWYPDEFQSALMNMTPIPLVARALGVDDQYALHRERILYTFDHLSDLSELEGPIFVFAHIIAPHPPFVFGPQGQEIEPEYGFSLWDGNRVIRKQKLTRDEYVQGYREQLIFVNSRIKAAIDGILSSSNSPPIIILQADHGPGCMLDWEDPGNTYFKERLSILNAYYLPGDADTRPYPEITPVNTFRVIFNHYFGTDYEFLADKSYYSTWSRPYAFIDVTDRMNDNVGRERIE